MNTQKSEQVIIWVTSETSWRGLAQYLLFKNLCRVEQRIVRFLFPAPRQENVRQNAW